VRSTTSCRTSADADALDHSVDFTLGGHGHYVWSSDSSGPRIGRRTISTRGAVQSASSRIAGTNLWCERTFSTSASSILQRRGCADTSCSGRATIRPRLQMVGQRSPSVCAHAIGYCLDWREKVQDLGRK
jgi:hypothetical protein